MIINSLRKDNKIHSYFDDGNKYYAYVRNDIGLDIELVSDSHWKLLYDVAHEVCDFKAFDDELVAELYDALSGYVFSMHMYGAQDFFLRIHKDIFSSERENYFSVESLKEGWIVVRDGEVVVETDEWMEVINTCISEIRG